MEAVLVGFGAFALMMLFVIPIALYYSFIAATLWGWFIVPIFNAPILSTWQMFAVVITLTAMRPKSDVHKETPREIDWTKVGTALLAPLISLGIGAIVKFWILGA